jgi:hypothetical protein
MSELLIEYAVLVRLPDNMGTVTEVTVHAFDSYTACRIAEAMTSGHSMTARRK